MEKLQDAFRVEKKSSPDITGTNNDHFLAAAFAVVCTGFLSDDVRPAIVKECEYK